MKMNTAFDVLQKLSFDTRLIALLRSCGREATVPIAVLDVFLAVGAAGAPTAFAQETVSGQVTDAETNASLPGVNVLLQGTRTGATTDAQGRYELEVPNPEQDTLVFSFVGYQDREIPINGRSEVNVTMESQAVAQDEVVVVGYGTEEAADVTGSVSSFAASARSTARVRSSSSTGCGAAPATSTLRTSPPSTCSKTPLRRPSTARRRPTG